MEDLRKNAEGYYDPTAYEAIKKCGGGCEICSVRKVKFLNMLIQKE